MSNERESYSVLNASDYNIAGNLLRVFSDSDGSVVFVLDLMVNETKPNVLLIINPDDDRKWDDILENDYGIDLETIRPKKDNKYQKLDIEYSGLTVYQDLINAYVAGEDIADKLDLLNAFRKIAVRRAASERLVVAETVSDNARETIDRANDSIAELNNRVRQLRAKLTDLRKNIGKEPTKQSAAKILRTESQIDAVNEKIRRAKKRLENAQKRLVVATEDAENARDILTKIGENMELPAVIQDMPLVTMPDNELAIVQDASVPMVYPKESDSNLTITNEAKAEYMADEEVKPLFDTDPEILDEEIAFKPIDFSAPVVASDMTPVPVAEPQLSDVYEETPVVAPISFTPPVVEETYQETDVLPSQVESGTTPMLDSITSVETPIGMDVVEQQQTEFIPQPVVPSYAPVLESNPEPDIVQASTDSGFRPVSPLTGVAPVAVADTPKRKQSVVYYIMLVALIVMSIFVLWFYQKTTGGNAVPNIGDAVMPEALVSAEPEEVAEPEPVVEEVLVTEIEEPEPVVEEPVVVEPVVQPEPEPEPMPEPVVIEAEPVVVEPTEIVVPVTAPMINTVPTVVPEPEVVKVVETEEEILAKKPAYGVSQKEAMFVADDKFETDRLAADTTVDMYDTPIVRVQDTTPVIQYQEPEIIEEFIGEDVPACEGGASPDRFGCCPGESYTQIDNGGFVCCPDAGGDCFLPLF